MVPREILLNRLELDLIGPSYGMDELIDDRPSDRYLTGILFPQNLTVPMNEDEDIENIETGALADTESLPKSDVSLFKTLRPAAAGISFAVEALNSQTPIITITISLGRYEKVDNEEIIDISNIDHAAHKEQIHKRISWKRINLSCTREIILDAITKEVDLGVSHSNEKEVIEGLGLFIKTLKIDDKLTVTAQAFNKNINDNLSRNDIEALTFFQFQMRITTTNNCVFTSRPVRSISNDLDTKISALIYRNVEEYATGHVCSATWNKSQDLVDYIQTSWIPTENVKSIDPYGDPMISRSFEENNLELPDAHTLSVADKDTLEHILKVLVDSYGKWLELQAELKKDLNTDKLIKQAEEHLDQCKEAYQRMKDGIELIISDSIIRRAFQASNKAMQIQCSWSKGEPSGRRDENNRLIWRPFQLGFILMCLPSIIDPNHKDRKKLDLIWFPTGGGKTEAYLLVTSFTLFYERLTSSPKEPSYGTNVIMRYTLRTLTIQQFQRATALVTACEQIRKSDLNEDGAFGEQRFSIGLWVGEASTPNKYETAVEALKLNLESTPKQITKCPACRVELIWRPSDQRRRIECICDNEKCKREECIGELPISTVDEQIYSEPPSLLIGTIDKFAQIVRNENAGKLFGINNDFKPPSLIIQDELHLISGPLGTISGIYETVIDNLCEDNGKPVKIIGSTATIRRAKEQVKGLFNRESFQFPPPVINHDNSGFAKIDYNSPGRLYVGITTAGRSDKYVFQAVCASLLQGIMDKRINDDEKDPYSTLVTYFNSLRKLGGALVAIQDDVTKSIYAIARRHSESARNLSEPEEMTSRKASSEIPSVLEQLNIPFGQFGSIDVLLASNMLSVGVDIPRLGLMVVNGQPKTMSEYIQATSRVGRQQVPGLVVTIYNNNKIRDRAHFETFLTWHSSLYRSIEATSVTPFASRARDKALHAALVALARYRVEALSNPTLNDMKIREVKDGILPVILKRIEEIDSRELVSAKLHLEKMLNEWEERGELSFYWDDYKFKKSLLISAEKAATRKALGLSNINAWETPNSMRNVEPGVDFKIWESAELKRGKNGK